MDWANTSLSGATMRLKIGLRVSAALKNRSAGCASRGYYAESHDSPATITKVPLTLLRQLRALQVANRAEHFVTVLTWSGLVTREVIEIGRPAVPRRPRRQ